MAGRLPPLSTAHTHDAFRQRIMKEHRARDQWSPRAQNACAPSPRDPIDRPIPTAHQYLPQFARAFAAPIVSPRGSGDMMYSPRYDLTPRVVSFCERALSLSLSLAPLSTIV